MCRVRLELLNSQLESHDLTTKTQVSHDKLYANLIFNYYSVSSQHTSSLILSPSLILSLFILVFRSFYVLHFFSSGFEILNRFTCSSISFPSPPLPLALYNNTTTLPVHKHTCNQQQHQAITIQFNIDQQINPPIHNKLSPSPCNHHQPAPPNSIILDLHFNTTIVQLAAHHLQFS